MKKRLSNIYYSFPFQLLILHLRSNHLILAIWVLLFVSTSGQFGRKFGIQYLFLEPEYLYQVSFLSFFILGLAFGGFFMSWNLTTYLLSTHHFPFLASLSRPFTKFCLNNSILPLSFFFFYMGYVIWFQYSYENWGADIIFMNCLGLLTGFLCLFILYFLYFHYTNRDISYYTSRSQAPPPNLVANIAPGRRNIDVEFIKLDTSRWKVKIYLNESLRPRYIRSVAHYDSSLLMSIFKQNHLNALIIQLISMIILLALGYLIDIPYFQIPAAASIFIMMSFVLAIIGAVTYWFNEWRFPIIILLLVAVNYFTKFDVLSYKNKAYGMNYTVEPATYSYDVLHDVCLSGQVEDDITTTTTILNNWKKKAIPANQGKPKMVILSVSGGGLKSASWTMQVIQTADSLLQGKLLNNTVLITGASGGMLGVAYLRELYLRKLQGEPIDLYNKEYVSNVSKDLLNPITFAIVSNDLFIPWTRFKVGDQMYHKDRGYIFEQHFNQNIGNVLEKSISDYKEVEQDATIPMLYLTPSIVNDGRRLIISPQGVSFMMIAPIGVEYHETIRIDAVDFGWLFKNQGASDLRYLTALRMNATYPYILPNVYLPSEPAMQVLDAGFRDNYGIHSATRFIQVFQDWIKANTSGVVIVQISTSLKIEEISASDSKGMIESIFDPIGIASKLLSLQEFEHDNSLGFIYDLLGEGKFDIIRFFYRPTDEKTREAAVSFHITEREKKDILNAINLEENQNNLKKLKEKLR